MKVTLLASISVNGKVLLAENPNHQLPAEVLGDVMQKAIHTGNFVLGKKTFELILQHPAAQQAFSGTEIVVLSAAGGEIDGYTVANTPERKRLQRDGHWRWHTNL